ncbi:DUF397 domain-containing protein [Lentzea sp. CA-135723]|uniref:DUF397 domain-containing protein n=1 Tax=Lentzea sp. CA-135723 TaxID=3239950 RepID=UPI003D8C22E7
MTVSPRPLPEDFDNAQFVISSYSGSGDTCVGVAGLRGWVAVEHSKQPEQGRLLVAGGWTTFLRAAKTGTFTS